MRRECSIKVLMSFVIVKCIRVDWLCPYSSLRFSAGSRRHLPPCSRPALGGIGDNSVDSVDDPIGGHDVRLDNLHAAHHNITVHRLVNLEFGASQRLYLDGKFECKDICGCILAVVVAHRRDWIVNERHW